VTNPTPSRDQPPVSPADGAALDRRGPDLAGLFALGLMTIVWSWWAWQKGAWFGVVFLPGAILLCAGLFVLIWVAPWRGRLRRSPAAAVGLGGLVALGVWAALSSLWTPAPNVAIVDGQRILVYALAFGLGIWLVMLLGARAQLSLVPLAAAGAVAGVITAVGMISADDARAYLEGDGTLDYPLGYRNANAAFFACAFFPALGLAADRDLDWRARAPALATATLCAGLAMLSQSRGSIPAVLIALAAYLIFSPLRLRALCWLALALLPALGVVPALTDLYQAANDSGLRAAGDELEAAAIALALTSGAALLVGCAAARFERVLPGLGSVSPRTNRGIFIAFALGVVSGIVALVVAVGDPIDWTVKRADEFRSGTPDLTAQSSRFTFSLGTDRYDLWRVALDDAREQPLRGTGSGGFQYSYLRERESRSQTAHDAHGVALEVFGELGAPGLVLLLAALGGAAVGAVRGMRLGPQPAALSAIALAAGAYWLAHASIDWFWAYPAITAPVIALLGSACAARVVTPNTAARGSGRYWIAAGAIVVALSMVPPFLSERYVTDAYAGWRADLPNAYEDLDRARALNPFTDAPLLAEGAIADAAGDRERAIAAFRDAAEERPEEWGGHFLLAELFAGDRPMLARRELEIARELNPNSPEIEELEERIARAEENGQD
jgi:tetratricopeptide (TPR) repeat protein